MKSKSENIDRIEELIGYMNEGLAILDSSGKVRYANSAFLKILTLPAEKVLKKNLTKLTNDKEFSEKFKSFKKNESEDHLNTNFRVLFNDITHKIIKVSIHKKQDNGFVLIADDKTHQAKIESELSQKEDFIEDMHLNFPLAYVCLDDKGVIRQTNNKWKEITGYEEDDVNGRPFHEFVSDQHAGEFDFKHHDGLSIGDHGEMEIELMNRMNLPVTVKLYFNTSKDDNGKLKLIHCIIRDITEHKKVEKAVIESEKRFRLMANSAPVMIWISNLAGNFTFVNQYWTDYTGKSLIEELGNGWKKGIHPEDRKHFQDEFDASVKESKEFIAEFRLKNSSGDYRWIVSKGLPMEGSDGKVIGYIGSSIDINDRKVAEESRKQYLDELENLNQAKDKFFSIIAHDLKSPLFGLVGIAKVLLREIEAGESEEVEINAIKMYEVAEHVFKLLQNLLDWSRIQLGKMSFDPEVFNIKFLVDQNLSLMAGNAFQKGIELEQDADPDLRIYADPNMINTVIRNLISNAIKFTERGGKVKAKATDLGDYAEIIISDTGIGIEPEV
ncbi:MAG: PAS domain S-box protein, partial [Bacteroidota bacterium]